VLHDRNKKSTTFSFKFQSCPKVPSSQWFAMEKLKMLGEPNKTS